MVASCLVLGARPRPRARRRRATCGHRGTCRGDGSGPVGRDVDVEWRSVSRIWNTGGDTRSCMAACREELPRGFSTTRSNRLSAAGSHGGRRADGRGSSRRRGAVSGAVLRPEIRPSAQFILTVSREELLRSGEMPAEVGRGVAPTRQGTGQDLRAIVPWPVGPQGQARARLSSAIASLNFPPHFCCAATVPPTTPRAIGWQRRCEPC